MNATILFNKNVISNFQKIVLDITMTNVKDGVLEKISILSFFLKKRYISYISFYFFIIYYITIISFYYFFFYIRIKEIIYKYQN